MCLSVANGKVFPPLVYHTYTAVTIQLRHISQFIFFFALTVRIQVSFRYPHVLIVLWSGKHWNACCSYIQHSWKLVLWSVWQDVYVHFRFLTDFWNLYLMCRTLSFTLQWKVNSVISVVIKHVLDLNLKKNLFRKMETGVRLAESLLLSSFLPCLHQ